MKPFITEGVPITEFKRDSPVAVFEDAQDYPQFFRNHLLDPNRVIKIFQDDPLANQRIFYYQYLKLCTELQKDQCTQLVHNLQQLMVHPEFYFIFPQQHQNHPFTDSQFKRFVQEFLGMVEECQTHIDDLIGTYPIMDLVFTYLFRSLLIFNEKAATIDEFVDRRQTFANLSSFFGLEINEFQNCIKFVDSDVFAFQQNPFRVFMAYIKEPISVISQHQQHQETIKTNQDDKNQSQNLSIPRKRNQIYVSNTSSGFYDFVDFTAQRQVQQLKLNLLKGSLKRSKDLNHSIQYGEQKADKTNLYKCSMELPKIPKQVEEEDHSLKEDSDLESDQNVQLAQNSRNYYLSVVLPDNRMKEVQKQKKEQQDIQNISEISSDEFNNKKMIDIPSLTTLDKSPKNKMDTHANYMMVDHTVQIQNSYFPKNQVKSIPKLTQPSLLQEEQTFPVQQATDLEKETIKEEHIKEDQYLGQQQIQKSGKIKGLDGPVNNEYSFREKASWKGKKLNVTKQFSNSLVLKNMSEPYRTNTQMARNRARAYRKSIQQMRYL